MKQLKPISCYAALNHCLRSRFNKVIYTVRKNTSGKWAVKKLLRVISIKQSEMLVKISVKEVPQFTILRPVVRFVAESAP